MILTVKKTTVAEEKIEIEFPAFYRRKDNKAFLAIFDESEVVKLYSGQHWNSIESGSVDILDRNIAEAVSEWEHSHEQEFRVEYDKVLKQVAIPRREFTLADLNGNY